MLATASFSVLACQAKSQLFSIFIADGYMSESTLSILNIITGLINSFHKINTHSVLILIHLTYSMFNTKILTFFKIIIHCLKMAAFNPRRLLVPANAIRIIELVRQKN